MTAALVKQRILGLVLILVIAVFIALTLAMYNKAFSSDVPVTLKATTAGYTLQEQSDVKMRGIVVGSVQKVSSTGDGAVLKLSLDPALAGRIPANVSARLLPKTLFGERYVDLQYPQHPAGAIHAGDTIQQDRTASAVELEKVLGDLMPVLKAVQPEKLSTTLTALSTALKDRGRPLGETLAQFGQYAGQLTPQLPTLEHDLAALAQTANTYADAAPDLVQALTNLTVTSRTIYEQRTNLLDVYGSMIGASNNLDNFLTANRANIIGLVSASRPTLNVLARYAPEYPCFLKQMAFLGPRIADTFGQGSNEPGLHITLEITNTRGKYVPGADTPRYLDDRGPRCYDFNPMPDPFPQYAPDGPLQDGSTHPPAARNSLDGNMPPVGATIPQGSSGQGVG
jgi:phospholipid/cholesterol/gamma-HCH transport system substrate-binding protein